MSGNLLSWSKHVTTLLVHPFQDLIRQAHPEHTYVGVKKFLHQLRKKEINLAVSSRGGRHLETNRGRRIKGREVEKRPGQKSGTTGDVGVDWRKKKEIKGRERQLRLVGISVWGSRRLANWVLSVTRCKEIKRGQVSYWDKWRFLTGQRQKKNTRVTSIEVSNVYLGQ